MEVLDCRRLTGPNVIWDRTGAVIDIACEDAEAGKSIARLAESVEQLLTRLDWQQEALAARKCIGGYSLALSAPLDALYSATEILEAAWDMNRERADAQATQLARLKKIIVQEQNRPLTTLLQSAQAHGVDYLADDNTVSLGLGRSAKAWPVSDLPAPESLDWRGFGRVPVGLVTGTNGKTTTSRLVANMLAAAGKVCGLTSTDWIAVGGKVIDTGDFAGPGGARAVLRNPLVEAAVLETARGGLLRRGLAVRRADAAVITNISEDHLGDFGSRSLEELLDIKWTVSRALDDDCPLILNADDHLLVARAQNTNRPLIYFSPDPENAVLAGHFENGGGACTVIDGTLVRGANRCWNTLAKVAEVPISFAGAARHNIANALAAAAMAHALGAADDAICAGLLATRRADNPGRCNLYDVGGIRILVDFAHNVGAMHALFNLAQELPAKRRILCFGQAGDRPDSSIANLADSAWAIGLDLVVISELKKYYRGREPNEVYAIMYRALRAAGARQDQIAHCPDEMSALRLALTRAAPGDLLIMLALADSAEIRHWLADKEQQNAG